MIHPLLCIVKPNFYPHSPCGERQVHYMEMRKFIVISIHTLLAESDLADCTKF